MLALANQLSRVHRRISFAIPDPRAPVLVRTPFPGNTLGEVLSRTVGSIDPCGSFLFSGPIHGRRGVSIGIGERIGPGFDWYIGADQAVGFLSRSPIAVATSSATLRGAGTASCLGAAALLRAQLGLDTTPRVLSSWNYAEGPLAATGPDVLESLDVGRVLLVGAGAVAASLVYWLHAFGVGGDWIVVDKDIVRFHNINRGLIFTAAHAGWPSLTPGESVEKANVLANLIPGGRAFPLWYDDFAELRQYKPDVILALANDRNVRHLIAARNATVTLHATTSANWQSQLHRHITGKDDCIGCRGQEMQEPMFGCSTAAVSLPDGRSSDAALPFLSAASGLMLATALQRLQAGELATDSRNDWRWDFHSPFRIATSGMRRCTENCRRILPSHLRRRINATTKWATLDRDGKQD
ncbi:MAG TPA: ThiF family adenylyltransferase [Vicinamibacterales bacterium]|nr:ThiF family adenylyltransferase [Vicinamibacterales bacterium]